METNPLLRSQGIVSTSAPPPPPNASNGTTGTTGNTGNTGYKKPTVRSPSHDYLRLYQSLHIESDFNNSEGNDTAQTTSSSPPPPLTSSSPNYSSSSAIPAEFVVNSSTSWSGLLVVCAFYIAAAASEIWVVNWLKGLSVNLPILFSIVQNGSWPIQYYLYRHELRKSGEERVMTKKLLKSYFVLGSLAFIISVTRMYGMSELPATLYVICANTEIAFETIMTKVILKRDVTPIQTIAVAVVIVGVSISLYSPKEHSDSAANGGGNGSSKYNSSQIVLGVVLSMISRFCSSLNTILAERLLGKEAKSVVVVNECAVANAIIPFFLSPLCLFFTDEYKLWGSILNNRLSTAAKVTVLVLLIALGLSKQVDRLCKYTIVGTSSTIFFAGIDAFMKTIAAIGCFIFFGEIVTWNSLLGIALITAAVYLLFKDKYSKSRGAMADSSGKSVSSSSLFDSNNSSSNSIGTEMFVSYCGSEDIPQTSISKDTYVEILT